MKKAIFKLVKLDTTFGWQEDFLKKLGITKIHTWYIFDANRITNCCELLPSYELLPVYEAPENEWDMTDENRDEFYDYMGLNLSDDTIYMHCHSVDQIAKDLPSAFTVKYQYNEKKEIDESWNFCVDAVDMFRQDYMHLL